MGKTKERRQHKRVPVKLPVTVHFKDKPAETFEGEILDISEGGAFIHCTAPVQIGKVVLLNIHFHEIRTVEGKVVNEQEWLELKLPSPNELHRSIIKWARGSSKSGFGVQFAELTPEAKKFVGMLVQYFDQLAKAGVPFDKA